MEKASREAGQAVLFGMHQMELGEICDASLMP